MLEDPCREMKQELLEQMCDSLLQAEKLNAMSTLTAGFAHDAGTPLMAISSLSQLLREKSCDPYFVEKLGQIQQSVDRITQIVRTLVDFSRPIRPGREKVYLNSVIVEAVRIVQHDRRLKYRHVSTELTAQIPEVEASADQLLQVLINLCLNAADALEKVPEGRLLLKSWHDGDRVHLSVEDSGIGISPEARAHLFSPFYTTKARGSGLGLYVSRRIIWAHGGNIEIQSEEGKGTRVVIALPEFTAIAAEKGA